MGQRRRAGIVNDRDIALVRATHVHGVPIAQVAALVGMNHGAAGKAANVPFTSTRAWWSVNQPAA